MYWYWWAWWAFVFVMVLIPLGYGWGYRGWGPPYPRYVARRRSGRRAALPVRDREPGQAGGTVPEDSYGAALNPEAVQARVAPDEPRDLPGWGLVADMFWVALVAAIIWAIVNWAY